MFEDSLMESAHKIKARSKYWSIVALFFNGGMLCALIVWPLLNPEALPTHTMASLMVAPPPPPSPAPAPPASRAPIKSEVLSNELQAPSRIPKVIKQVKEAQAAPAMDGVRGVQGLADGTPGGINDVIGGLETTPAPVVKQARPRAVSISSGVMAGNLLEKTIPQYPAIAKAARIQGVVALQATISKTGSIQNLRVMSGPPMLQQAALDAVQSWRYKPYLLNGEPVAVETTINVVFSLGQ